MADYYLIDYVPVIGAYTFERRNRENPITSPREFIKLIRYQEWQFYSSLVTVPASALAIINAIDLLTRQ
ncbi:MAG: hypothetical protein HYW24_02340 [Candidatus Aenigmarchaeota archaeon]|nr:hypothetical protein [Candidatus Aenigmarchaeota archaeon]